MSDYCSLAEALSLVPDVGALRDAVAGSAGPPVVVAVTATKPSATQGGLILIIVSAEISAALEAKGYALPLIHPVAVAHLTGICMSGTAARIAKAKWPSASGPGSDGGAAAAHEKAYERGLAFIAGGGFDFITSLDPGTTSIAYDFDDYSDVATTTRKPTSDEAPF